MQHFLAENNPSNQPDCLIIGLLHQQFDFPTSIQCADTLQTIFHDQILQLHKKDDWAWYSANNASQMIVFNLGLGIDFNLDVLQKSLKKIFDLIKDKPFKSIGLSLPQIPQMSAKAELQWLIKTIENEFYQFDRYKSQKATTTLSSIYYNMPGSEKDIQEALATVAGIKLCKDLANTPANDCTPLDLEIVAKQLAKDFPSLQFKSLDVPAMQALGMNTLLSVGQGSAIPPRLIELHYQHDSSQQPLILIGKGITFDSGGICLKPADPMFEMKYDMIGAASVLGTMKAIAMLELPIHVIGLLACAENMPSGTATRPGDVIKSYQGKTIEIINTDAEGRLVLADAMTYAQQYQPQAMVDIATLTGAIIVALGGVYTGMMSNDEKLAKALIKASQSAQDKLWQLPLDDEYKTFLESPVADLANAHLSRVAGSITAAHFLNEFAEKTPWAHLDIAGSAWISGKNRQATGRPVALLLEWLKGYIHDKN